MKIPFKNLTVRNNKYLIVTLKRTKKRRYTLVGDGRDLFLPGYDCLYTDTGLIKRFLIALWAFYPEGETPPERLTIKLEKMEGDTNE